MRKIKTNIHALILMQKLEKIVASAYKDCGYGSEFAQVIRSKLPKFAHYQSNGSFLVAKKEKVSPMEVAEKISDRLKDRQEFRDVTAVKPGFVNFFLSDDYIVSLIGEMFSRDVITLPVSPSPKKIIIDFGGANIAKPLHVGHLRSAIIGESIKRIGRFLGHEVIGDIHLGDWGLQMGMVITELHRRKPSLPYFNPNFTGEYPKESPVTVAELDEIYPAASRRAKEDEESMEVARLATVELQNGRPGYIALWQKIVQVSVADLKRDYGDLGVDFDLWLGESDANKVANEIIDSLVVAGKAYESDGAIIMEVSRADDSKPLPPLMLKNSNGAILYGATDLATIKTRIDKYCPEEIIYVVDKRQSLHLEQVFRGARHIGLINDKISLEHVDFGTMNGVDNKPFKTRSGGTMKLKELIQIIVQGAKDRIKEIEDDGIDSLKKEEVSKKVGIATLKFADLSNYRTSDYIFDVERFSSFEGRTGPYLLYSIVRANSILEKAQLNSLQVGNVYILTSEIERDILLKLLELPQVINESWIGKSPKLLCDFAYDLSSQFSRFYHECPVLSEKDSQISGSRLLMVESVCDVLIFILDLLGIETVEKM